ncbi:hypothetical protein BLOT_009947 [Blomia tropicalis]|nr:hypothetical protein BLOT_009947 [Blomia tropicalis]
MNQSAIEESSINHLSPILTTTTVASSTVDQQQQQQPELQPMSIISNGNNQQIIGMKHKRDLVDSLINHGPLFQQVNNDDDDGELVEEQQKENEKVKNKIKQEWLNKILLKMALQPTIDRLKQQQQERENNVWLNNEITDYDVAKMLGNNRYRTSKLMVSKPTPTISGDGVWFKGRWIPKAKMSSNNNDIMIQTSTSSTLYKNRTSSINEDENKFVDDRRLHRPEIDDEGAVYGKTIRRGMRETGGKKLYDVPQIVWQENFFSIRSQSCSIDLPN